MSQDRSALLASLAETMSAAGDAEPGPWDGFSLIADITALGVRLTGFRYSAGAPGQPLLMDSAAIETIAALRSASPGPQDELFDVYVARFDRPSAEIVDQAFTAQTGAPYRVTAANLARIAEMVRPGAPFLPVEPPAAQAPPEMQLPAQLSQVTTPAAPDGGDEADRAEGESEGEGAEALASATASDIEPADSAVLEQPRSERPDVEDEPVEAPTHLDPVTNVAALDVFALPISFPPPQPEVNVEEADPQVDGADASLRDSPTPMPAAAVPAAHPAPAAADRYPTVTTAIAGWREMTGDDWTSFGGAATFSAASTQVIGFRYTADGAVPTFIGGDYLAELRTAAMAHPDASGRLPGAALIRVPRRNAAVQIRFVYGAAAEQIMWQAADDTMAARLRPDPDTAGSVAPRPACDLLGPAELVARIKADVAADLRGRDSWRSFALGVDSARNRAVAYLYDDAGTAQRHQPLLSPLDDLAELRTQTARDDGSQWAGALLHSWRSGGDRVDATYLSEAGIAAYLSQGPEAAGLLLRPDADPPSAEPLPPWPVTGGHLDASALLGAVSSAVLASPGLAGDDWDRLAVVVTFGAAAPAVLALRFRGGAPGVTTPVPDAGPIGKWRRSGRSEAGQPWNACVLRGFRGANRLDPEYRYGSDAEELRVDETSIGHLGDRLRPI